MPFPTQLMSIIFFPCEFIIWFKSIRAKRRAWDFVARSVAGRPHALQLASLTFKNFLRGPLVAILIEAILTRIYNHGQTSWNTCVSGAFSNSHRFNLSPSPHKQCWTRVSRFFSEFQLCIGWGEGELQENFGCTRMHYFKRESKSDRKIWILQYCPKDFCPGLWIFL